MSRLLISGGTYHSLAAKRYDISLLSVQVDNLDPVKKFKVKLYVDGLPSVFQGTTKGAFTRFSKDTKPLCNFTFRTDTSRNLRVKIKRSGMFSSGKVFVDHAFYFIDYVTNHRVTSSSGSEPFTHSFDFQEGVKIQFTTRIVQRATVLNTSSKSTHNSSSQKSSILPCS